AVRLPDSLSLTDGALVEPLACGSHAVGLAGIGPESRVLVIGAGPVGLAMLYWVRRAGCTRVVAAALSDRNAALAQIMGATGFVTQDAELPARVADVL